MEPNSFAGGRSIAALSCAFLLASCSTADYSKPVSDFAAATSASKAALADLNTQVTEAYRGVLDATILRGDVLLQQKTGDCQVGSVRCRLVLVDKDRKEVEPYPPEPPLARMTIVMTEIDAYAANLKALLEADTAKQAATQVNAALGSIQHLATTVASMDAEGGPAAEIPSFATPVGEAVNWVLGQYVEHVKLNGLQQATRAAQPVIRLAADLFAAAATFASDVPKIELANEVSTAQDTITANRSQIAISSYAQSAAKYDALLTSGAPDLFQRMGDAHDALAESLQDKQLTLATAYARIQAFAAEAEKLAKILQDLRALAPKDQGG
jgi:hypothetical protein